MPEPTRILAKVMCDCQHFRQQLLQRNGQACGVPQMGLLFGLPTTIPRTHRKLCPSLDGARAIFESAERARVEAIGARQLVGVGANLEAALNQRYEGRQIEAPGSADEAGIAEVVRLLLREDLTGAAPPQNLSMVLDLWRPWVTSRAGDLMQKLAANLEDQEKFAQLSRQLIGALESDLGDPAPIRMMYRTTMMIRMTAVTARAIRTASRKPLVMIKAMVTKARP